MFTIARTPGDIVVFFSLIWRLNNTAAASFNTPLTSCLADCDSVDRESLLIETFLLSKCCHLSQVKNIYREWKRGKKDGKQFLQKGKNSWRFPSGLPVNIWGLHHGGAPLRRRRGAPPWQVSTGEAHLSDEEADRRHKSCQIHFVCSQSRCRKCLC